MKPLLVADIEVYHGYFLAAFLRPADGKIVSIEMSSRTPRDQDEAKRQRVRAILLQNRIVTFNGIGYDMPLLWYFVCGAANAELKQASDRIINGRVRYWEAERLLNITIPREIDHVDLIEPQPNPFASLKTLNGRLHGPKMQDLPIEPDAALGDADMDLLTRYCANDLDATWRLYEALREPLEMREAIGAEYGADFRSKSDAQMGEAMIKRRVEQAIGERVQKVDTPAGTAFKYRIPDYVRFHDAELAALLERLRETEFYVQGNGKVELPDWLGNKKVAIGAMTYKMGIGGLHSTEENRALNSDEGHQLVDFDVASYYPAIILNSALYPRALGSYFLSVYRQIRDERVAAKRRVQEIDAIEKGGNLTAELERERGRQKAREKGLKIALNGCFGKLGSPYSVLYAPHLMIAVTLTGQLALLLLIDRAEAAGIPVVSANTDGIVFRCPRDRRALLTEITARWSDDTGFELEATDYRALYSQSVNSYIAIKADGKAKIKGPLATPRHEGDLRTQLMKNPQMEIISLAVVAFITESVPLERTIRASRDVRDFVTVVKVDGGATWRGEYLGKVVRYVWAQGGEEILRKKPHAATGNHAKVPRTDGCRPLMELPTEFPADLDYDRYVAAAEEVLRDIGYAERPRVVKPLRIFKHSAILYWAVAA